MDKNPDGNIKGELPFENIEPKPKTITTTTNAGFVDASEEIGWSTKAQRQEFFLPVSGFVWLYPEEVEIVDHPIFQRLGRINQLGQAYYSFRGASHKRMEHVLGTVHVVQKMIAAVNFNADKTKEKNHYSLWAKLNSHEERFIRLAALLHDIGHVAAGHTLEDELGLLQPHDADSRITELFNRIRIELQDDEEIIPLREIIDEKFGQYVPDKLRDASISASEIVRIIIRKLPFDKDGNYDAESDEFEKQYSLIRKSKEIRLKVCANMVGNTICADLLDYIHRDWYHVGKPRSSDERIFQYMEIRRPNTGSAIDAPIEDPHPSDEFVISLGRKEKIRTDGVSAILGFLEWRYDLAETVLFHRTKVAAGAMLERALFELWRKKSEKAILDKIISCSDDELVSMSMKEAKQKKGGNLVAATLLRQLRHRNLFDLLVTIDASQLIPDNFEESRKLFSGGGDAANNRISVAKQLECDFRLPEGSVAVYCLQVKPKIAEVSIAINTGKDSVVEKFCDYERKNSNSLSGGHLDAQINRFERLWRLHFFVDENVLRCMTNDDKNHMKLFVKSVILNFGSLSETSTLSRALATSYVTAVNGDGELKLQATSFRRELAAHSDDQTTIIDRYPNGAPCMRNYYSEM